ncbi:MAG TPA: glycosyltransferase family 9 protein [Thermoanaerobaculia bacterium]|nr:glycosyltransferase family 9 protein [Thermoanaerobaculia bacterium]
MRPKAENPFADLPASAYRGRLDVLCFRPLHHVLEFEGLHGLLTALREKAPEAEIHLHLRSALTAPAPFGLLPVDRVSRLSSDGGRGKLTAGLRSFLAELPEGASCVLIAPPRGLRRLLAACPRLSVAAAVPLDFHTNVPSLGAREAADAFLAAVRAESPRWAAVPAIPFAPPPRDGTARFLVHQARFHVGDTLWLTPLLREIRRRFRGAEITVVGPPAAGQVLAGNPRVGDLQLYHPAEGEEGRRRVLAALADRRFDVALFAFARRRESRWLAEAAAGWGVPWRINLEYHDLFMDGSRPAPPFTHEGWLFWGSMASPRSLLHTLDPLLRAEPWERFQGDRRVEIHVSRSDRTRASEVLGELGIGREPFAVIAPGGASSRRWPAENFARLAVLLGRNFGLHVILEGAPAEAGLLAEIAAALPPGAARQRIVTSTDPLGVLAALLEMARLLIANDSAPIHLGESVAVPTLYFAQREKLAHSHPRTRACWALYDDAGNDPAAITVEQALGAVREMVRRSQVRIAVR